MQFLRIAALALLCIALIEGDATSSPLSAEEYWHSILPHTPMPKYLKFLLSGAMNEEIAETKYPYANFFEDDLHDVGKQMNIKFNIFSQPTGANGLWKRNKIGKDLNNLTVEEICNDKKLLGEETKFCAESIESLLDFVISKLGNNNNKDNIEAITGSFVPHQTQYTILEGVKRVSSRDDEGISVMCHKLNSKERLVFYCHQVNATKAYIVPMEAGDGTRTSVVSVCHHDTRGLDPQILFNELKVVPGTVPVCHFMGSEAITWTLRSNKAAY